jgi:transposase
VPKPYPKEFRDDVVRVAENRDPGVTIERIAADFGVHPMTLTKWLA